MPMVRSTGQVLFLMFGIKATDFGNLSVILRTGYLRSRYVRESLTVAARETAASKIRRSKRTIFATERGHAIFLNRRSQLVSDLHYASRMRNPGKPGSSAEFECNWTACGNSCTCTRPFPIAFSLSVARPKSLPQSFTSTCTWPSSCCLRHAGLDDDGSEPRSEEHTSE